MLRYLQLIRCRRELHVIQRRSRLRRRKRLLAFKRRQRDNFVRGLTLIGTFPDGRSGRVWAVPKSTDWWDTIVNNWDQCKWLENFRMKRHTFDFICDRLRPFLTKNVTHMRQPVSVEKRVAITLWKMATNIEYRSIAHMFGVGRSTVGKIVLEVSQAISEHLSSEFINIPRGDQLSDVVRLFNMKWGFPQCFGAVDGSHIPIVAPDESPKDYYNRKGWVSINVQALVDSRYRFMDLCIGWPGSVHDARVFSRSQLYERGEEGSLVGNATQQIAGVNVPLVILGDAAYPLLPWLMTPYRDLGRLTLAEKKYNYRQSRARMVVENAFGRLKGRWRVLLERLDNRLDAVPHIIMTCAILHNICETFGERFYENWHEDIANDQRRQPRDMSIQNIDMNNAGDNAIRNALTLHLSN